MLASVLHFQIIPIVSKFIFVLHQFHTIRLCLQVINFPKTYSLICQHFSNTSFMPCNSFQYIYFNIPIFLFKILSVYCTTSRLIKKKIVSVCWQNRTGRQRPANTGGRPMSVGLFYSCPESLESSKNLLQKPGHALQDKQMSQSLFLAVCCSTTKWYIGKCFIGHNFFWTFKCIFIF